MPRLIVTVVYICFLLSSYQGMYTKQASRNLDLIITAMKFLILTSVSVNSLMSLKFMTSPKNFVLKTFCGFSAVISKYLLVLGKVGWNFLKMSAEKELVFIFQITWVSSLFTIFLRSIKNKLYLITLPHVH